MVDSPIARSPIIPAPPVVIVNGWEVSARTTASPMRLIDCTSSEKTLVRAPGGSPWASTLKVELGQARRDGSGRLVAGIAPEQWLFIGAPGMSFSIASLAASSDGAGPLTTVTDLTHAAALMRLVGTESARLLCKLCGINLDDRVTPDHSALRTSIAKVVISLIRDDAAIDKGPLASYLIMCDRSAGQYLFNVLLDAGREFEIDVQGFAGSGITTFPLRPWI